MTEPDFGFDYEAAYEAADLQGLHDVAERLSKMLKEIDDHLPDDEQLYYLEEPLMGEFKKAIK